jgi:predicted DNA-binding transcriptional regulator YafY
MKNEFEHLSVLQTAISSQTIIDIIYNTLSAENSKREVEPIGLIFYAFNWHLIAWCHLRNEYRDFRVSRIEKIRCLEVPFRKVNHMKLSDYMKFLPVNY